MILQEATKDLAQQENNKGEITMSGLTDFIQDNSVMREGNKKPKAIHERFIEFHAQDDEQIVLNAVPGHFATIQSHINYYVDVTSMKVRTKEAREAAKHLVDKMRHKVEVLDTIVCMDGTQVLGAFLAEEVEKTNIGMSPHHETIRVVCPEVNSVNQLLFRENIKPSIQGRKIFLLLATMTTGETVRQSMECIEYYGGDVIGVSSIFSTRDVVDSTDVFPIFTIDDLPGYESYKPADCPFCKKGIPIEAMVNGYGYSKLR